MSPIVHESALRVDLRERHIPIGIEFNAASISEKRPRSRRIVAEVFNLDNSTDACVEIFLVESAAVGVNGKAG